MVGEWRIDSSSNRHFSNDHLIVLSDGSFYIFSGADGGSLLTSGKKFGVNQLATIYGDTLKINLLDSNRLCISGGWNNNNDFFQRRYFDKPKVRLNEYLESAKLRSEIIGWWKFNKSKSPIRLINYSGYCDEFTLNIRTDGQAIFYLENNLDSTVNYTFKVNIDGIDFNRGCVVNSNCHFKLIGEKKIKLVLDRLLGDTLVLERITKIN